MSENKEQILENVQEYTAFELANFIKEGIVSFEELCNETDGCFPARTRREVKQLLEGSETSEWEKVQRENSETGYLDFLRAYPDSEYAEEARSAIRRIQQLAVTCDNQSKWDLVNKSSIEDLRRFVRENPNDSHVREARIKINQLEIEEDEIQNGIETLKTKIIEIQSDKTAFDPIQAITNELIDYLDKNKVKCEELLNTVKDDNNFLSSKNIKDLIDKGYIEWNDLKSIGINEKFINYIKRNDRQKIEFGYRPLSKIEKESTEIYFWGIPSSGKSCALGAIMSVANNGSVATSMELNNDCQGYGYMIRLSGLFKANNEVGVLPPGTPTTSTYEMGFDLKDEKLVHPITCIDLAGELVRCMYKSDAGETLTVDEVNTLETLKQILVDNRTGNRKIHFFVLEYGGENRLYEGLSQQTYLQGAMQYIKRTKIFEKDTDAIYLMITKVDKTGRKGQELRDFLTKYIDENYKGFYQTLVSLSKQYEINGGVVERIPFSLGKVCFQDFCLFEEAPAANVVKKILDRSKGFKTSKWAKRLRRLNG